VARRVAPSLFAIARRRLSAMHVAEAEAQGRTLADERLRDYIPRLTPGHDSPDHLGPLLDVLERIARGEVVRVVISAPPRHAKTETLLAAIAWLLGRDPRKTHGYATYEANLAKSKSRIARQLAQAAGVKFLDDRPGRLSEWRTAAGGGLLATSVGGPFTGQGITGILVIDDSLKNRLEAESKAKREQQKQWFADVATTRLEPGASCIVTMARWHDDDLAGHCIKLGFEYINLPAIDETTSAPLWGKRRPLKYLQDIRRIIGEFSWSSLFMGVPRSREGRVFKDVELIPVDQLPRGGMRIAIGVDLAYSKKTKSDWSVAVVLGLKDGKLYVLHVLRMQAEAPAFARKLKVLLESYPGVRPVWYGAGTEKGTASFIRNLGIPLIMRAPRGDKFIRAQPAAAAWNAGRILVPGAVVDRHGDEVEPAPEWAPGFVERVTDFTGSGKSEVDDEVDALAPAFDVLAPFLDAPARPPVPALRIGALGDELERDNGLRGL
jgi:predicted phage terminase large subunit-like protein